MQITGAGVDFLAIEELPPGPTAGAPPEDAQKGAAMTDWAYEQRRLKGLGDRALPQAQMKIGEIKSLAMSRGAFGGSRMYLLYDQAADDVVSHTMRRMARVLFESSGATSPELAKLMLDAGMEAVRQIMDWLEQERSGGRYQTAGPSLASLRGKLEQLVTEAVDDFSHGMVGDETLARNPVVTISNTISDSPGTLVQNLVGQNNQQSAQQQALLRELDIIARSDEVQALDETDRTAVQDLIDVLRAELVKREADPSRVARWGRRLIELSKQLGLHVAAAAIAKLLFVG